jgi:hypothetical protein
VIIFSYDRNNDGDCRVIADQADITVFEGSFAPVSPGANERPRMAGCRPSGSSDLGFAFRASVLSC